jgi:hypothetical protein
MLGFLYELFNSHLKVPDFWWYLIFGEMLRFAWYLSKDHAKALYFKYR